MNRWKERVSRPQVESISLPKTPFLLTQQVKEQDSQTKAHPSDALTGDLTGEGQVSRQQVEGTPTEGEGDGEGDGGEGQGEGDGEGEGEDGRWWRSSDLVILAEEGSGRRMFGDVIVLPK